MDQPRTLKQLVDRIAALHDAGTPSDEIMAMLTAVARENRLRIVVEHGAELLPAAPGARTALPEDIGLEEGAEPVGADIPIEDTTAVVDTAFSAERRRIALVGDRRAPQPRTDLWAETNGLVLDGRTWRVLSWPACPQLNQQAPQRKVNAGLARGEYEAIPVEDGTIVTLYRFGGDGGPPPQWGIATANGYDVSSYYWLGDLTYAELIYDLVWRLYPEWAAASGLRIQSRPLGDDGNAETRLSLDGPAAPPPGASWTFGFRHHNFHPLIADPEKLWQIRVTDLATGDALPPLPGLPEQTVYEPAALGGNLAELRRRLPARPYDYGVILRRRAPAAPGEWGLQWVLQRSPLLEEVRHFSYERAPLPLRADITALDRQEFNAWRAFLSMADRQRYLRLYPEWTPSFHRFNEFVTNVINRAILIMRRQGSAAAPKGTNCDQVAHAMVDHITTHEPNLNAFHADTPSVVRDYVVNPEYAFLFMRAMRSAVADEQ